MDDFENTRTRQLRHYDTPQASEFKPCCPRCFSPSLAKPEQRAIDGNYYYLTRVKAGSILSHVSHLLWWCEGCGNVFDKREAVELRALAPVEPPSRFTGYETTAILDQI